MIIQNMRYDNIIGSEIVVESQVEESLIPKLTLQPLVENSIYHGMKVKEGKTGTLYLTAYKNEEEVIIKAVSYTHLFCLILWECVGETWI